MPKRYVRDIQPGQEVASLFVIAEKQLRVARNGTRFLTLKLVDKTGEITGRIWERAEEIGETLSTKGAVFVRGRSEVFRDELQLQIQEISPRSRKEIDPSDFLPTCPKSVPELWERLAALTSTLKRRSLQRLMKHVLGDRELVERFKLAPAAKSIHHAYLGGLIEHSVSVAGLVSHLCGLYTDLDRDLLVVGAILHDVGKIDEFEYDLFIDYSHIGRLLGHMVLGAQILDKALRGLKNFPAEDALLLKHLILSHHGEAEFGAVRLPMTREAFALHFADDLDAKMNTITRILADTKGDDDVWTPYQPMFERFFFRGLPQSKENRPGAQTHSTEDQRGQLSLWRTKREPAADA